MPWCPTRTTTPKPRSDGSAAFLLLLLVGWALLAFAGAYRWTTVPLCAGAALLLVITRPAILRGTGRILDAALLLCLIGAAAQMVPLPASARDRLSPHGFAVDRVAAFGADPAVHPPHPLSVDVEATAWAVALAAACVAVFWCARAIFATGGV